MDKALREGSLQWIATSAMRCELGRVLDYWQIAQQRLADEQLGDAVLAQMDLLAKFVEPAPKLSNACKDPDDQIFIDLACQHQCWLVSKDKAVLSMRSQLAPLGVTVASHYTVTP